MPYSDDPYTRVHNAIWAILEQYPPFTELVRAGNRIKLTGQPVNIKAEVEAGDLPEVEVVPADDAGYEWGSTANSLVDTAMYRINVFTGTMQLDDPRRGLYPLKWALISALRFNPRLGLPFVEDARLVSSTPTPRTPRGSGWGISFLLKVVLRFKRTGDTLFI